MVMSGCFYVKPLPEPVMPNTRPTIIEPADNPATKRVWGDTFTLVVYATDPDGDEVRAEWLDLVDVRDWESRRYAVDDFWVMEAEVRDLDSLPSTSLRALVHDGNRDNGVTVRWDLVFPGGAP